MLLTLAAGLDYRGLYELAAEGIPGVPPAPPGTLPTPEELRESRQDEQAEAEAELERSEAAEVEAEVHRKYRISQQGMVLANAHLTLQRWLGERPGGLPREETLMRDALGPLLCGWSGMIVHALAPEPLSLDELDRAVTLLDREGTHKHVKEIVRSGIAEAQTDSGATRYALTEWGRAAIAPLVAAVVCEAGDDSEMALPPDVFDVEAGFQMALPLLRLPPELRGSCRLGVEIPGGEPLIAGATAQIDGGVVASSSPLLEEDPETWVSGDALGWCETVIDPEADKLYLGGDAELAEALIAALHERLFAPKP
jgi:DNA-binding HxlR family transcriptional regulator